ncbi:MAG: ABC transporter substrate-binding protein [Rhodospirillales bacterium]|nr:ABC transporter substrate-binding protein [Rhodospirillales bacterium]
MSLNRRLFLSATVGALAAPAISRAATPQDFTLILDWFVNPDHAPLFAAKYCGAYEKAGINVKLIAPTDPDVPPRLVAAGKADAALTYQTQLYLLVDQGLPVRRTGTLINQPLNTLTALKRSGVTRLQDLKGRKVGYSVAGVEPVIIGAMLKHVGMSLKDIQLVNVNFELVSALRSNEVDAVIGTYRTYEDIQLAEEGLDPVVFLPEDYGVPPSDELLLLSNVNGLKNPALSAFLGALKEGVAALKADPDGMLTKFLKDNPSLNDKLDIASWHALPPYFDTDPAALNVKRYKTYRDFLFENGVIKQKLPLSDYAVTIS